MIIDLNEEKSKELLRVSRLISVGFSTSEALASHVVVYKTLGIDRELAQVCMKELARRRTLGEDFDYEQFIEDKIKEIPKMQGLDLTSLGANMAVFKKSILGE
jgi:hypothetical protein